MALNSETAYAVKRLLQANISHAALLEAAANEMLAAARYLRDESLAINTDLALPDFTEPPKPEPPPPAGGVTSQFGIVPVRVASAIAAAWPADLWTNAADLCYLESGWNPRAQNDTLDKGPCGTQYHIPGVGPAMTEDSRGLFQVNVCAHGGGDELYDPDYNAVKGYEIYTRAGGWSPWYYSAKKLGLI